MPLIYWCTKCPLEEECSQSAWKRAQVWGYTREEAVKRCVDHLTKSGLHRYDERLAHHLT